MTDFIDTDHGCINLDSVVRMRTEEVPGEVDDFGRPLRETRVYYRDEHGEPQRTWSYLAPESVGGTFVPAAPGYFFIGAWRDPETGEHGTWREPIVAWRVEGKTAIPVGLEARLTRDTPILTPDGQVLIGPYDRTFDSVDEYIADFLAKAKAEADQAPCPAPA